MTKLESVRLVFPKRLSWGDAVLDKSLSGGIPLGCGLVEIAGESATGKTTLLMSLCINAQLSVKEGGLGGSALFINTEGNTSSILRLQEMYQQRKKEGGIFALTENQVLNNVLFATATSAEDFWVTIGEKVPNLLVAKGNVRLIVIDSIASLFRGEFVTTTAKKHEQVDEKEEEYYVESENSLLNRNGWLFGVASILKRIASQYNCLIVISNQVSFNVASRELKPALGLVWSNCVSHRYMLEFSGPPESDEGNGAPGAIAKENNKTIIIHRPSRKRRIRVCFSSVLPETLSCTYLIMKSGFVGVE